MKLYLWSFCLGGGSQLYYRVWANTTDVINADPMHSAAIPGSIV